MLFDNLIRVRRRDHIYGVLRAIHCARPFRKETRPMNWATDAINVVPIPMIWLNRIIGPYRIPINLSKSIIGPYNERWSNFSSANQKASSLECIRPSARASAICSRS